MPIYRNLMVAFLCAAGIVTSMLSQTAFVKYSSAQTQEGVKPEPAKLSWLKVGDGEHLAQLERQMRGFDITMMEVGYRYDELVEAVKSRNYEYAKYQTEKISHVINLGIERRPKRANSAKPFLDAEIPKMLAAIAKEDAEEVDLAIQEFHKGCIRCHRSENVLFMGSRFAKIQPVSVELSKSIADTKEHLTPETLANGDRANGQRVFKQVCSNCHSIFGEGSKTGPDIQTLPWTDTNYLVKAIVAPNAIIGFDYQSHQILTADGVVLVGLILEEDDRSLKIQTATETVTVSKSEIEERRASSVSVMPEGLLQKLSQEEVRDLFAYLQQGN
jgi:putative heme-binding domain-containing protein